MKSTKPASRGFTLIELLVVIAIIAILAAILFPVFAQAREKARQITCVSNLKQLSLACLMYTQDYDEIFPIGFGTYGAAAGPLAGTHFSWPTEIAPYVKSLGVYVCPDDAGGGKPSPGGTEGTSISYAANGEMWADWGHSLSPSTMHLVGPMGFESNVWDLDYPCPGWNVSPCSAGQQPVSSLSESKINIPDGTILLTEVWSSDIKTLYSGASRPWWENDSANYPAGVSGNDVIDQNQIGQMPNPYNYAAYPQGANGIVSAHNRQSQDVGGLASFAFADGHVKAMNPIQTHINGWNNNSTNMWDSTRSETNPYQY